MLVGQVFFIGLTYFTFEGLCNLHENFESRWTLYKLRTSLPKLLPPSGPGPETLLGRARCPSLPQRSESEQTRQEEFSAEAETSPAAAAEKAKVS